MTQRAEPRADGPAGTFVAQRTKIDPTSGTAEQNKLFAARFVAPGATFALRLVIQGHPEALAAEDRELLLRLLATFQTEGLAIGRGKGDGQGRVRLSAITTASGVRLDGSRVVTLDGRRLREEWDAALKRAKPLPLPHAIHRLTLTGREPFIVKAPGRSARHDGRRERTNVMEPLRRNATTPELPGSSFMGVLRSRAVWWARREGLRGREIEPERLSRLFGRTADELAELRKHDPRATPRTGLLRVLSIASTLNKVRPVPATSVRIDRFTMAPIDGALFTVEAFPRAAFVIDLSLDERATADDEALLREVLAAITAPGPLHGLMLGHGGNRGFGWFDARCEEVSA